MISGDLRPHQDVLKAEYIHEYETAHADIWHRLVHINTSIEILEAVASFPLKHLFSPDEPFFDMLYWNFSYTCFVMLHALLGVSEACGIRPFKNRLVRDWLPEHERLLLRDRLRTARFTEEWRRIEGRAADMRKKIIAHRDPRVVANSLRVPGLTIGDLRKLYDETENLFGACSYAVEYITSRYPGGTVGGKPVERDIDRFMGLPVRNSAWFMQPEEDGQYWPAMRERMSRSDLDELNHWRIQLGLSEA